MSGNGEIRTNDGSNKTVYTAYAGAQSGITTYEYPGKHKGATVIFGGDMTHQLSENTELRTFAQGGIGTELTAKVGTELTFKPDASKGTFFEAGLSTEYARQMKSSVFSSSNSGKMELNYDNRIDLPAIPNGEDYFHNHAENENGSVDIRHDENGYFIRHKYEVDIPSQTKSTQYHPSKLSTDLHIGCGYEAPNGQWKVSGGLMFANRTNLTHDITHTYEGQVQSDARIIDKVCTAYTPSNQNDLDNFVDDFKNICRSNMADYHIDRYPRSAVGYYYSQKDIHISGSYSKTEKMKNNNTPFTGGLYVKGQYKPSERVTIFGEGKICLLTNNKNDVSAQIGVKVNLFKK